MERFFRSVRRAELDNVILTGRRQIERSWRSISLSTTASDHIRGAARNSEAWGAREDRRSCLPERCPGWVASSPLQASGVTDGKSPPYEVRQATLETMKAKSDSLPALVPLLCICMSAAFFFSDCGKGGRSEKQLLAESFVNPPDSTRPGVYWYFMDGNISREGMTADLESMKAAGIGSVLFLEVNVGIPRGSVDFMSDEWLDLFRHARKEAERLGMTMKVGIGPGWTGSGGPWVKPGQSMQHLVSSLVEATGPTKLSRKLPRPRPKQPFFGLESFTEQLKREWSSYYRDVAVLAYPAPAAGSFVMNANRKIIQSTLRQAEGNTVLPQRILKKRPSTIVLRILPGPMSGNISLPLRITEPHLVAWSSTRTVSSILQRFSNLTAHSRGMFRRGDGLSCVLAARATDLSPARPRCPASGLNVTSSMRLPSMRILTVLSRSSCRKSYSLGRKKRGITSLHMDSWEMTAQNWSANFRSEFQRQAGV